MATRRSRQVSSPVGDREASIHSPLQGSKHLVASGGSGKTSIQVAGERTWLAVNSLHVELVTGDLHLALVHLVQAELVQELGREVVRLEETLGPLQTFGPMAWAQD